MKNIGNRASKKQVAAKMKAVRRHELKRAEERRVMKSLTLDGQQKRKSRITKRVEGKKIEAARRKIDSKFSQ